MAFNWNLVTNALGTGAGIAGSLIPGIGPIAGSLLPGVFQGLGDVLGITDSSSSSPGAIFEQSANPLAQTQMLASYTKSGMEGGDANREAFMKSRELIGRNTAESLAQQNQLRGLASQARGSANLQMDSARQQAMTAMGNDRRQAMQAAQQAGASPAAIASIAGQLGRQGGQNLLGLNAQNTQANAQGINSAGALLSQADQSRLGDLQNRIAEFDAFALQKFGGTNLGQLGGLAQAQSTQSQVNAIEDPLALLKAMGGQFSGMNANAVNMMNMWPGADSLRRFGTMTPGQFGYFGNMARQFPT